MKITDTAIVRQPADVIRNTIDRLPFGSDLPSFDLPDFDLPDLSGVVETIGDLGETIGDTIEDVVTTVAATSTRGVRRVGRIVRRHPRIAGLTVLVVLAAIVGALVVKRRRSAPAEPRFQIADAA